MFAVSDLGLETFDIRVGDRPSPDLSRRIGAWGERLRQDAGIRDAVPGLVSLTLHVTPDYHRDLDALAASWDKVTAPVSGRVHDLALRADGEDLNDLAAHAGWDPAAWIAAFTAATFTVACFGFIPGFPYLLGLPDGLAPRRRDAPRPRVSPGSVAVIDGLAGIYPQASPGGWHLVGHTDPQAGFILAIGDEVRFHR